MAVLTGKLWKPGRTLRVRFLDGLDVVKAKVEQMVHIWESYANIKFLFGTDPAAEIRISFVADPGSWSYIGTDALVIPQDRPTVNFGWLQSNTPDSEYQRVVVHELGHALGCIHEHSSPAANIPWNKPAVYRYYAGPPNNWPPAKVDANVFFKYSDTVSNHSAFDPLSIMIYPIPKEFTDGVFEVKLNSELSELDKSFIASQYPQEPKPGVELVVGAPAIAAAIGQPGEEDLYHFTVAAAGSYKMETTGGTDMVMGLFGPNDLALSLASDDDSGPGLNSQLLQDPPARHVLPASASITSPMPPARTASTSQRAPEALLPCPLPIWKRARGEGCIRSSTDQQPGTRSTPRKFNMFS